MRNDAHSALLQQFLVRASYLEIYNEEIRDLLAKDAKSRCELKEDAENGKCTYTIELRARALQRTRLARPSRPSSAQSRRERSVVRCRCAYLSVRRRRCVREGPHALRRQGDHGALAWRWRAVV